MKKHRKLKIFLIVVAILAVAVAGYFLITGWLDSLPKLDYKTGDKALTPVPYPDVDFAVISDLHLYDHSLGTDGAAFEETLLSDRKLLLDGVDLLDYAISEILKSNARFVLIPGDLTKDGERVCHDLAVEKLSKLTDAGVRVYVVPGNHDVNNPGAVSYSGDTTTPVEGVSSEDFARIYAGFGYGDALERDVDTLSYVAEVADSLWLLAIDACRSRENTPGHEEVVGGKIHQDTADWIARVLDKAAGEEKAVMVMIHHGVVEHWDGQHKLHPDYLIEDYRHIGGFLASYNVRLAFTGHYHAQDITKGVFGDKYIYDVETGSLVTAPCPIRHCSFENGGLTIGSSTIVEELRPGTDFAPNAMAFVKATVYKEAFSTLKKYKVSDKDADIIADAVGDAFAAHYSGDEDPAERPSFDKSRLGLWGRFILMMQQYVLDGLWVDLPPADVNVSFPLG